MSANLGGEQGGQDVDLNLAPIIDCLTVLITFMLASASFLSIGIMDAGVAAGGAAAADHSAPPPVNVTVGLGSSHDITIQVTGKSNSKMSVAPAKDAPGPGWNYAELTRDLQSLKARWPSVNAVTLTAASSVEYENVVKTMEEIRKTMPVVLLGGF